MRATLLAATLLALLASAAPALAHGTHGPCYSNITLLDTSVVHVDLYLTPCQGATVETTNLDCVINEVHLTAAVHTPVLAGDGCETGLILEAQDVLP